MAIGDFGEEPLGDIGADHTINKFKNASANYQKVSDLDLAGSTAVLNFGSATPADYAGFILTFTSTSGTSKSFIFTNGGVSNTGDLDGSAVVVQISGDTSAAQIAAELERGIRMPNGFGTGVFTPALSIVSDTEAVLTLTQAVAGEAGDTNIVQTGGGLLDPSILEFPAKFAHGFDGVPLDQVPFSLGLSGIVPFNIGSTVSNSAYTMTKGKQISTE